MVQRIGQALGAYGNLGSQKGTERFLEFIPPGEKMMARALNQLDGFSRLKGFFV